MSRQTKAFWAIILCGATFSAGCKPVAPFYLGEHDDLSHYIDVATKLDYPDVHVESLGEVTNTGEPLTLSNPEPRELWDLTLEESIQIALHNNKVLKSIGGFRGSFGSGIGLGSTNQTNVAPPATSLQLQATAPDATNTVYDVALQESNVLSPQTQGVESALAAFDAQFTSSFFWDRTSRPQNGQFQGFFAPVQRGDTATITNELSKTTAAGTQLFFRNNNFYEYSNSPTRAVPSDWIANFEMEARQPLLRGAGVQVNRAPVVLARIRTDISLADFECAVRDMVRDVENTYWELYVAYRSLEAAKAQRDSVHAIWRNAQLGLRGGTRNVREEAQARQDYFRLRAITEGALVDLFQIEMRLRFLMGLSPSDCRLIRPIDEPINARICFDWHAILHEALARNCEIRIKRWQIKQRETELITARNQLLPQVDAVALYRWLGRGDELLNDQDGPAFPAPGSDAYEELFHGDFQEWRLGVQMNTPIGFRRELAGVRNAQLSLARECALLKETELEVVHALADRIQRVDGYYNVSQTNFNRRVAAENEVRTLQAAYEEGFGEGSTTLNLLLDALQRRAEAQSAFFRTMVNYTVAISEVHALKGSLLEYDNILLAEGPWPQKAYYDAMEQARKRAAGHYLDYGYTRPRVVSAGEYPQFQHGGHGVPGEMLHDSAAPSGEEIDTPQPESAEGMSLDALQMQSTEAKPAAAVKTILSQAQPAKTTLKLVTHDQSVAVKPVTTLQSADPQPAADAAAETAQQPASATGSVEIKVKGAKFDWGPLRETKDPQAD
jgi:outer membrane protein TolC